MQATQNSTQVDEEDIPESGTISPDIAPKDATEAELEKLVFGDETGFLEGIKTHEAHNRKPTLEEDPAGESADEDLDGLQDSDVRMLLASYITQTANSVIQLFFLDAGDAETRGKELAATAPPVEEADRTFGANDRPAWEDSDDERIMVSLATNTRLRKLRNYEGEDMVNGREYIKRLRRQFVPLIYVDS